MHKFAIKEMDQQQYECAKMEEILGTVTEGLSRKLQLMLVYHSVRKPGHVLELNFYKGDYYQCSHCRTIVADYERGCRPTYCT